MVVVQGEQEAQIGEQEGSRFSRGGVGLLETEDICKQKQDPVRQTVMHDI